MREGRTGPEAIFEIAEPAIGLEAFIVVDSTRLGPAFGGIRIRPYREERLALADAIDLAAAMTLKAALAALPCGGGKIVVIEHPGLKRGRALEALGRALNGLRGRFFAGRDYGMSRADLVRLRRATRYAADESPRAMGDLGEATARGTMAAMGAALAHAGGPRDGDLHGARVAVEGLGAVGIAIARRLLAAGAAVWGADPDPDAARRATISGVRVVSPGRLVSTPADVFVPAGPGRTIDEGFAARSRARIVCGPANNAVRSLEAEASLRRRGIVFVPDLLASSGALIAGALYHIRRIRDAGPAIDAIGPRVRSFLREVDRSGLLPTEVAGRAAFRRLKRAARPRSLRRRPPR